MVKIGHAAKDESGKLKYGEAGDQTGKEVFVRDWYNKPWIKVFRPKSAEVAEKIAKTMEQACKNDYIGYDQSQRRSLFDLAKENNWDITKIKTPCETDCSGLVTVCVNAAGIDIPKMFRTKIDEDPVLTATGQFTSYTSDKYCKGYDYLKRGDILLAWGHTAVVLTNGSKVNSSKSNSSSKKNEAYAGKGIGTATVKGKVNVRSTPNTKHSPLATLKANTTLEVLDIADGWYQVVWTKSDNGYAYISAKYCTYKKNKQVNYKIKISNKSLNIRKGPSANYSKTGAIKDKSTYTIIQESNGFGQLKSGAGWIKLSLTIKQKSLIFKKKK